MVGLALSNPSWLTKHRIQMKSYKVLPSTLLILIASTAYSAPLTKESAAEKV